jgi:transposase InsO family protein
VKYAFIKEHCSQFRVSSMCRVLQASASGYYDWRGRGESDRMRADMQLLAQIRAVHSEHRQVYGAVKTWRTLKARGVACGKHRVARLRREAGIESVRKRAFRPMAGRARRALAAPDLLQRHFVAPAPNRIWVGDMTQIRTFAGWLYLAVLVDLYSRKIVGWAMGSSANEGLALSALDMAIARRRPPTGLIQHTDQGTAYTSQRYRARLSSAGLRASNGGAGACYDNAAAESFFSALKNEMTHQRRFRSTDEARAAVFDYIEVFYNRKRIHQHLDYRTPEAVELAAYSTCPRNPG